MRFVIGFTMVIALAACGSSDGLSPLAAEGKELLADAPPGLRVENRVFEVVPLDLVRGVVTERGFLRPPEVAARLRERAVPPALFQIMFSPPPPRL